MGLVGAVPIMLGYFPIAFSFLVGAVRSGLSPTEAVAMSVIIYGHL